ncbi:MAG TPA: UbiA-like polyprenyltransferase [Candidatus Acidoferrales bacterium]|nr:UbiA-like polyprenyltransferase [Candidatus Acidoferrales bacterium]
MFRPLVRTLRMIRFEHSLFALPFAFLGALLAAGGWPTWRQVFWIVVAMVGGRSAAMAFNRIADVRYDAQNPRTAGRELPTGQLSLGFTWVFTIVSAALLVLAAWQLNPLALKLSPVVLAVLLLYSYTKRFTVLTHWVLGFCLGMAPAGAWIAVRGTLDWEILPLTLAVLFWVAGFDIIYACQDVEFDRRARLFSLPARIGIGGALMVSRLLHVLMFGLLVWLAQLAELGVLAYGGLAVVAGLLAYEHSLVRADDLSRVNAAFFTVNGYISVLLLLFWGADILVTGR